MKFKKQDKGRKKNKNDEDDVGDDDVQWLEELGHVIHSNNNTDNSRNEQESKTNNCSILYTT
eukprot:15007824-Ditylum_brightwellii.AAC.1